MKARRIMRTSTALEVELIERAISIKIITESMRRIAIVYITRPTSESLLRCTWRLKHIPSGIERHRNLKMQSFPMPLHNVTIVGNSVRSVHDNRQEILREVLGIKSQSIVHFIKHWLGYHYYNKTSDPNSLIAVQNFIAYWNYEACTTPGFEVSFY